MSSENENLKSTNKLLIVVIIIGAFFLGALVNKTSVSNENTATKTTQQAQNQNDDTQTAQPTVSIENIKALFNDKSNIVIGDKNSKNLIVEISDPSCPYCHVAGGMDPELNKQVGGQFTLKSEGGTYTAPVPEIKKMVDEGKAAFVYLYANGHGAGEMAAKALYCAHDQGKFWAAHELIMSNAGYNLMNNVVKNDKTKSQELADFLSSAVDKTKLKQCLDSGKYDKKLADDMTTATSLNFQGTPDFYINTSNFVGAQNWTTMQSALK